MLCLSAAAAAAAAQARGCVLVAGDNFSVDVVMNENRIEKNRKSLKVKPGASR